MTFGFNFETTYKNLSSHFFTETLPEKSSNPEIVLFNERLSDSLGLDKEALNSEGGAGVFSGNEVIGETPLAMAYAGHQFGQFTMLGDGRALLLGEHMHHGERYDVQLKGSGRTDYSRAGDGRAPLGPMLREYIISEAMHALGVPTTRSLAVTLTGDSIMREQPLKSAVLTRVASSHLRAGTFQYAVIESEEALKELTDYAIERHYPDFADKENKYELFLEAVIHAQSYLIAKWQSIGFIHGVMNTDNMAISGETIDYGPCAFIDHYDPATVFSSIDVQGRYQFRNQPGIAQWNLAKFAETLIPLLDEDQDQAIEIAQKKLNNYKDLYQTYWLTNMVNKLGIATPEESDVELVLEFLEILEKEALDHTSTFRALSLGHDSDIEVEDQETFDAWVKKWHTALENKEQSAEDASTLMKNINPAVIPRNHLVEEALFYAVKTDDLTKVEKLVEIFKDPYSDEHDEYYKRPPKEEEMIQNTFCGT
ncbi:YdiU family protein [Salinicoccus sp. YB14-2]|uniref:protein adenylyltransferase SelO n=1 Tax=Salinicoccus sp. YB14-2 TaxID=1572701 RepID=UPI000689CB03|nr:YdiU family protein [Salinicoccus sp. YB14-2]